MRQITRDIVRAFGNRQTLKIDNSRTDGTSLYLFNNRIAEWRADGLWITNAGWQSKTTKERLNGLSGVQIQQVRGNWFLNGRIWSGEWVNVDAWNNGTDSLPLEVAQEPEFDITSEWMAEGYSKPIYAVYHTLNEASLTEIETMLNGIPTKRMESDTEGVYRPNYFIVVRPEDIDKAVKILSN